MSALLIDAWPILAGLGLAILGFWRVYIAGQRSSELKQIRAEAEARDIADQVDADIGTLTPEQRRQKLREWSR
jgi:hypothetical protein